MTNENDHTVDGTGWVFWVTGLAGAGKTTIAHELLKAMKANGRSIVLMDGDQLRAALGEQQDYSIENRKKLALTYGRLANLVADQGVDVICATISMFHECRAENRKSIRRYFELYVDAPLEVLKERNQKKLYTRKSQSDTDLVVLPGPELETPESPDMVIVNDGSNSPSAIAQSVIEEWRKRQ